MSGNRFNLALRMPSWRLMSLAVLALSLMSPFHCAKASDGVENAGDIVRTLIPAIAFSATVYLHDSDGRSQFYKSFFSNLAVTYALKQAVDKTRPNGKDDDSFPSGHTSVAFQGAAFIHKRYGLKYAIPAYVGASFVAWSRVDSDNHFTTDVLAGAAIGVVSSLIFTKPYKGVSVTPLAGNGFYGLSISTQW